MSKAQVVSLIVTLIILISLCVLFTLVFRYFYLQNVKSLQEGELDKKLIEDEIKRERKKKSYKVFRIVNTALSYSLVAILTVSVAFGIIAKFNNGLEFGNYGNVAISSGSMSKKNENNSYLFENNLNNQIQTYDLITIKKIEKKEDLKLFDIICFKADNNKKIVHRIIEITDEGYVTKGDANKTSDYNNLYKGYLKFDRIIGKYINQKVGGIGLIVIFLQSPSGILTLASLIYCLLVFDRYKAKYEIETTNRISYLKKEGLL